MPGDPLQKPKVGDPFKPSSQTFGMFIDAAADFKARTQNIGQKPTTTVPQRTIIPIKNMSGADRLRFDVLEILQPLFALTGDAGKERPMAVGTDPTGPTGKIAVLLEPVLVGYIGNACVSGVTVARVDVSDTDHQWADLEDGECLHLASMDGPGTCHILSAITETGSQYVLLKIGMLSNSPRRFELKTALEVDGSATAYLREWTGAAYENSATEFLVYDVDSQFHGAIGAKGRAEFMPDRAVWEVYQLNCP